MDDFTKIEQKECDRKTISPPVSKTAIVTGASSGIGAAISDMLCELGYTVFGFGRDFRAKAGRRSEASLPQFHPVTCDLLDTEKLLAKIREIKQQHTVYMLVNCAGVGYYGPHEQLNPEQIKTLVRTNLELPLILTQQLLRELKAQKGYVINVSSVTAVKSNPHGCAYGATKAGLSGFSESLFDEVRKYGVKVINLQPDMTKTNLYRDADFREGEEEESYLLPEEVADVLRALLSQRETLVATNITLQPQIHRIRRKK